MIKAINSDSISRMWNSVPLMIRSILIGSLISGVGVGVWGAMFSGFKTLLAILPMILFLWLFWNFFSGSLGKGFAAVSRRENFRQISLPSFVWKCGLLLSVLFVIIVQASFVITYRLIDFPAAKFTADYKIIDAFPVWVAFAIIVMGSVVAGICEEVGFRGYMQVPMEKQYGTATAIITTSLIFTCIHLGHTWALPILPHIFCASILLGIIAYRTKSLIPGIIGHSILDIFDYSIWWTDIAGGFTKQPISKTGVDAHFIFWVLLFALALSGFFKVTGKLKRWDKGLSVHSLQSNL